MYDVFKNRQIYSFKRDGWLLLFLNIFYFLERKKQSFVYMFINCFEFFFNEILELFKQDFWLLF